MELALAFVPIIILAMPFILFKSDSDSSTLAYATAAYNFSNISGTYRIPDLGFQITLPKGWSGIGLKDFVMVSPMGINSKTAVPNPSSDLDKVIFVLSAANVSDIAGGSLGHNASSYQKYIEMTAKIIDCKVVSDKFAKVNGTTREEMYQICGPELEQKAKAYAIASGKSILYMGLKGNGPAFDHNIKKFEESIRTIKINEVTDIKRLLSGFR